MKQRIITACVGLCVLAVVLAKFDTWALNLAVSVISLLAVGEVLHVIDSGSRTLTGIGLIFSVLIPFSRIAAIPGCAAHHYLCLYCGTVLPASGSA